MDTLAYPRLIRRVRAILIDSVLLPVAVFGTLILGDWLGVSAAGGKATLFLLPVFILEPGLVALTGGTVGHHLQGLRVATMDGARNVNIFAATLRFIVKMLLGWLSLFFVLTTAKHQAVHDLLARSVVVHKDTAGLPASEVLAERVESAAFVRPAPWRRVIVILGYAFAATIIFFIVTAAVSSDACMAGGACTSVDVLLQIVLNICWLVGIGWIFVRGWEGKLFGARRRPHNQA